VLEVGKWVKSSSSDDACVEVMNTGDGILMRQSSNPIYPILAFSYDEWNAFVLGAKDNEFDI
jgi:hypothetical protein